MLDARNFVRACLLALALASAATQAAAQDRSWIISDGPPPTEVIRAEPDGGWRASEGLTLRHSRLILAGITWNPPERTYSFIFATRLSTSNGCALEIRFSSASEDFTQAQADEALRARAPSAFDSRRDQGVAASAFEFIERTGQPLLARWRELEEGSAHWVQRAAVARGDRELALATKTCWSSDDGLALQLLQSFQVEIDLN